MRATISGGSASSIMTAHPSSIMCTANIYDVDAEQRFEFSEAGTKDPSPNRSRLASGPESAVSILRKTAGNIHL